MKKRHPMSKGGIISLVIIGVLAVIIAAMLINNGIVSKKNHKTITTFTETADITEEPETEIVSEEPASEEQTEAPESTSAMTPDAEDTSQAAQEHVEAASANITVFSSKGVQPKANEDITLKVVANGVSDSAEYKFLVHNEETDEWYVIREYKSSDTTVWNTGKAGKKTIYVDVKNNGKVVRQSLKLTVK